MKMQKQCNMYTAITGWLLVVFTQSAVFGHSHSADTTGSEKRMSAGDTTSQVTTITTTAAPALVFNASHAITSLPETLVSDQMRCLQSEIPLTYNKFSKKFISQYLTKHRKYITQMTERQHMYFPMYEAMLQKHGLPLELKYLSVIESSLNPRAISRAKAAGLWQFMPSTGRFMKLHQDAYIDERMHPVKATEAACLYLKSLYNMFGDWHLALAAYNCGPGNVRRAIRRSGNKTTFWQIYNHLPAETKAYVPKFIATAYVMQYAGAYNIDITPSIRQLASDTVIVNQYLNIELLAKIIDVPLDDLRMLNPHVKKNIIPAYLKNYAVHIPAEKKDLFSLNRTQILAIMLKKPSPKYKVLYRVRKGDVLNEIAVRHDVIAANIKQWNRLKGASVKPGSLLVIWKQEAVGPLALTTRSMLISKIKVYFVKPGDNLAKVSQIHGGISVERIIKHNRLHSKEIRPGQKLFIS